MEGEFVFFTQNPSPPMRQSTKKDILNFLHEVISGASLGQFGRRICLMAFLTQSCVRNCHCRMESLSEATLAYQTEKNPVCCNRPNVVWATSGWTGRFLLAFRTVFSGGLSAKGEIVLVIDGSQTGHATTTWVLRFFSEISKN